MKIFYALFVLPVTAMAQQISEDAYTRYELLNPQTQSFRILFEVTATTPGIQYYYNTLRKGSEHKVNEVIDQATGQKLEWTVVSSEEAGKVGYIQTEAGAEYLKVNLSKPIAQGSEARLKIDKTYKDSESYHNQNDVIVFKRSLGVKRNAVVLPPGYEIITCNYPAQIMVEEDGRVKASFINPGEDAVNLLIEARKLSGNIPISKNMIPPEGLQPGTGRNKSKARITFTFPERAHQTRDIVYFLQQPETHSFRLYHDYTETREGMDRYINVVRTGSKASHPSAKNLDTGEDLKVETLKGDAIKQKNLDIGEPVTAETEVVVIWYSPVKKGQTTRLRIEETYTDANRYLLQDGELIWDRSFGRPLNTVVLPEGWYLTANAIPATVNLTSDQKVSLTYVNDAPEEIDVYIKARRRD